LSEKWKPMSHQKYAIKRLAEGGSQALFVSCGLGKTSIVLTHIQERVSMLTKVLVIAPPYVAQTVWPDEATKWEHLSGLKVQVIKGPEWERRLCMKREADVYCISRNHIQWIVNEHIKWTNKKWKWDKVWPFGLVVLDEAASFKAPDGVWFKNLARLRRLGVEFINLTGTPSPNGLLDLWAQMYLLDGGQRLGASMTYYKEHDFRPSKYMGQRVIGWEPLDPQSIYDRLSDIAVSMRAEDWIDLPEVINITVETTLSEGSRDLYNTMKDTGVLVGITAGNPGAVGMKLLQISNGAVYDDQHEVVHIHSVKLEATKAIVDDADTPVLVFTSFIHDKERLLAFLPHSEEMKGAQTIRRWNERKIPVLIAHPAEIGHGLNLQGGGRHIIWFGIPFNLGDYLQANARLVRTGQPEDKVIIHHIVGKNTRDEQALRVLGAKGATQEQLMEALAYGD